MKGKRNYRNDETYMDYVIAQALQSWTPDPTNGTMTYLKFYYQDGEYVRVAAQIKVTRFICSGCTYNVVEASGVGKDMVDAIVEEDMRNKTSYNWQYKTIRGTRKYVNVKTQINMLTLQLQEIFK